MTPDELRAHLSALRLSVSEASLLLSVSSRTIHRWLDGEDIPGPASAALRAWLSLELRHLPWKPDSISVLDDDIDQIARLRNHAVKLNEALQRVETKGGPKSNWSVSIKNRVASFGPFEIGFYNLENGSFSISTMRRMDIAPSRERDSDYIDDATHFIALAFEKANCSSKALKDIAVYTRSNANIYASGKRRNIENQTQNIKSLALKLEELSESVLVGQGSYSDFEKILKSLQNHGFFPKIELVSAVAQAMA